MKEKKDKTNASGMDLLATISVLLPSLDSILDFLSQVGLDLPFNEFDGDPFVLGLMNLLLDELLILIVLCSVDLALRADSLFVSNSKS